MVCPSCLLQYGPGTTHCLADGTELVPDSVIRQPRLIEPGTMVGEYRVEELLGEGTFGHVYRCVHPIIGRGAAIKVLKPAFSGDPEILGRFVEEARAANRIRHRGIIDIFGFGALPDGRHYYVMELLDGITLEGYVAARGVLDVSDALPILRAIARAMDAAHAAGVVHRDLKPANVFLCLEEDQIPRPKVLDFGIAKLLSVDTGTNTRAGTPLGTPHYMSPEQSRGLPVDKATDVYAFGVMVFELLTGKMPLDGATGMDILMQHIGAPVPRPSDVNPRLSATVNAPVLQMLAKDPAARPSSLTIAVEDLARATGHTWALMGPRNSSHSALAAVTPETLVASLLPPRQLGTTIKPVSSAVDLEQSSASDPLAPRRARTWIAVGLGAAVVAGGLLLRTTLGHTEAASVGSAAAPPATQTPPSLTAAQPSAAAVQPVVPVAPAPSASSAAPAPVKRGHTSSPSHAAPKHGKEIDVNPY